MKFTVKLGYIAKDQMHLVEFKSKCTNYEFNKQAKDSNR